MGECLDAVPVSALECAVGFRVIEGGGDTGEELTDLLPGHCSVFGETSEGAGGEDEPRRSGGSERLHDGA
jgi:hypothetical protein